MQTACSMAPYFATLVFPRAFRISSIRRAASGRSSRRSSASTSSFRSCSTGIPPSPSQAFSWARLFGFFSPVISRASSCSFSRFCSSWRTISRIIGTSSRTPRSFIRWSSSQSSCSLSASGYRESFSRIAISVTTSCRLYSMYSAHLSGSCCGRFLVLPLFDFVGLQGLEKYWIRLLPIGSFSFSSGRPRATPAPARDPGRPHSSAMIIVSLHCSGGISSSSSCAKHVRSKAAFQALFSTSGSVRAFSSSLGQQPGWVQSCTFTGPPSIE